MFLAQLNWETFASATMLPSLARPLQDECSLKAWQPIGNLKMSLHSREIQKRNVKTGIITRLP